MGPGLGGAGASGPRHVRHHPGPPDEDGSHDQDGPHDEGTVLAVDIGGTKLAVGVVDGGGAIVAAGRTPTPRSSEPETVFTALSSLIDRVLVDAGSAGIRPVRCGVGCGGPMERGGRTVSPLNIPGWRAFPLRRRLSDMVGIPVAVDNDAKALALAEGWLGAAAGRKDYLAMVVSTGIGGGIVLDGRLLDGASGNAGHIGHVVVEPEGRRCACGGRGCLEAEASGLAIEAATGGPAADAPEKVRHRTGVLVGRAVASVANLLDLSLAVVAGSVALGYGEVFFSAAQEEIGERAGLEFSRTTHILPAGLGVDGPLLGAALLAEGVGRPPEPAPGPR